VKHKININYEKLKEVIDSSKTMSEAASKLQISFRSFKKIAEDAGLYQSNYRGWHKKIKLEDILNGKYPQYPTSHLSKRLVKEGLLEYKCNECKITEYNDKPISLELNHIDGNRTNHELKNLELLCPNCHSQTETFASRNKILKNRNKVNKLDSAKQE